MSLDKENTKNSGKQADYKLYNKLHADNQRVGRKSRKKLDLSQLSALGGAFGDAVLLGSDVVLRDAVSLDTLAQLPPAPQNTPKNAVFASKRLQTDKRKIKKGSNQAGNTDFDANRLQTDNLNPQNSPENEVLPKPRTKADLYKKARQKYFTRGLVLGLVDVWTGGKPSPLEKSYWNSFHCVSKIHQKGKKLTSLYCNTRWCMVCNRVRTAKLINGYLPVIKQWPSKWFVTLTIPNVKYDRLAYSVNSMLRSSVLINRNLREKGKAKFYGLRKFECTYNAERNDYHPHLHFVIDSESVAREFINQWLSRYPSANRAAQDVREADNKSVLELFKYFTKVMSKAGKERMINLRALDTIFQSMQGKRVFQPLGIKKVSEDVNPDMSEVHDLEESDGDVWLWLNTDWVSSHTGELLTNYTPTEQMQNLKLN